MWWIFALMLGCDVQTTADAQTLRDVDEAFCALATECWSFYDSVGQCLADNALAQQDCVFAPAEAMRQCAHVLSDHTDQCTALVDFSYPTDCVAYCSP